MRPFDQEHLILLMVTICLVALGMYAARKLGRRGQNILFALCAGLCAGGIFWCYAMNFSFSLADLRWKTLAIQMLQVCNFNFILVLLMLVPRFELARQYSIMFSMFAAATVMVSFPDFGDNRVKMLNFWFNHVFAIALPLLMLASGRLKPQKKYIAPVSACVIVYFLVVYGGTEWLRSIGEIAANESFSYVHSPDGVGLLELIWKWIDVPCFYLVPLIPPMVGFFYLLCWIFRNRKTQRYGARWFANQH